MRREPRILLGCLLLAYLIFQLFFAWVLAHHDYETEYLGLGSLAVRGEIGLYQDELTGQWTPLPFWVYGATQVLFGPGLLLPRLLSVALGGAVLALAFALAARWGGVLAATAAGALFVTHGVVMGYFATVDFAPLAALLHLAGLWVLFCTRWRGRDVLGMLVFSLLFLVKPNYWPTVPFVLVALVWRARGLRARLELIAAAIAVPALFFASAPAHLKLLAYVPVLSEWVRPLGYTDWFSLVEDTDFWRSDYVDLPAGTTALGRLARIALTVPLLLKRYAVWTALLLPLAALRLRRAPGAGPAPPRPGLAFTGWLFGYLTLAQFLVVGPFTKQAYGYVGAIAPLLAVVLGCLFADAMEPRAPARGARAALAAALVAALVVSPWVHRQPTLPRTISLADATVPALRRAAARLAALIPPGETRVFLLGDSLALHLAGRRSYLRQFHQWWLAFTSAQEPERYARLGLWGRAELERWLGEDARWAIVEDRAARFYRARAPYHDALARMDELLARNFTLLETVPGAGDERFAVYRRR